MRLQQRIRQGLPDLPKKLAMAARYALDNPERIALDSMRSTAVSVGVTSTTMLRLARELGFENYEAFRSSFQAELIKDGFGARAGALRSDDPVTDGLSLGEQICLANEENLKTLRASLVQDDIDALAELMRQAPNVHLVGSGSMFWVATLMRHTGAMILPNLRLVGSEYAVAAEAMGALEPEDVVICFGMHPTALRTHDAIEYANAHGAVTAAIIDRVSSPIADNTRFLFHCQTDSPHYYPSLGCFVTMVEAILASVVAKGGARELERIKEVETIRKTSGRYSEA